MNINRISQSNRWLFIHIRIRLIEFSKFHLKIQISTFLFIQNHRFKMFNSFQNDRIRIFKIRKFDHRMMLKMQLTSIRKTIKNYKIINRIFQQNRCKIWCMFTIVMNKHLNFNMNYQNSNVHVIQYHEIQSSISNI